MQCEIIFRQYHRAEALFRKALWRGRLVLRGGSRAADFVSGEREGSPGGPLTPSALRAVGQEKLVQ